MHPEKGIAQGCSLSLILLYSGGRSWADGGKVGGLLFADDFVGVSELQKHSCRGLQMWYIVTVGSGRWRIM